MRKSIHSPRGAAQGARCTPSAQASRSFADSEVPWSVLEAAAGTPAGPSRCRGAASPLCGRGLWPVRPSPSHTPGGRRRCERVSAPPTRSAAGGTGRTSVESLLLAGPAKTKVTLAGQGRGSGSPHCCCRPGSNGACVRRSLSAATRLEPGPLWRPSGVAH